jgi:sugar lactone lactonase YvrE
MKQFFRTTIVVAAVLFSFGFARTSSALGLDVVATFDPAQGQLPESVTIDDAGNLYMSMSNTVTKLTPQGQFSVFGTLPISGIFALGVKVGPDGCVYTVSTSLNPTINGAFVWKICSPDNVVLVTPLNQSGHPNDLAFDDDCNLYVTDPLLGIVYKVLPNGTPSVWLSDPLLLPNFASPVLVILPVGVDGIAFDKQKKNLYLSNLDYGRVMRVPFHNGAPGAISVFVEDPQIQGSDGIAFDNAGNLFVAVNFNDRLAELDHQGRITILAAGPPLDGVSSMVFGARKHDESTLYIASSAFARAFGIQAGTPHPALLKASVQHKGLPLP